MFTSTASRRMAEPMRLFLVPEMSHPPREEKVRGAAILSLPTVVQILAGLLGMSASRAPSLNNVDPAQHCKRHRLTAHWSRLGLPYLQCCRCKLARTVQHSHLWGLTRP